ncbi:MAG: lysophospholipid acyltransferase family protein [Gammaproteobacteria bacterium]|nr:lysophospholipid acyltransferase family protein [Gammaproteobacteria bacterium]
MASAAHTSGWLHPRYWPSWLGLGVLRIAALLPLPLSWLLGSALGQILYYLHGPRRRIARRNIAACFPALDAAAQRRLARGHFRALGAASLTPGIGWWASDERLRRLIRYRNRDLLDAALTGKRPVILLAPHFIGLEMGGMRISQDYAVVSMYKRAKNALFDRYMRRGRERYGVVMVERNAELRPMIRLLRAGRLFYYLPDQDPGRRGSVFAPFFGIPTATVTALARIAKLADAAVIPCFTRQLPYGRGYEIIFHPPLADFPSGDELADATRMNQAIEEGVREMPAQYFWVHKRFKTRPENAPAFY